MANPFDIAETELSGGAAVADSPNPFDQAERELTAPPTEDPDHIINLSGLSRVPRGNGAPSILDVPGAIERATPEAAKQLGRGVGGVFGYAGNVVRALPADIAALVAGAENNPEAQGNLSTAIQQPLVGDLADRVVHERTITPEGLFVDRRVVQPAQPADRALPIDESIAAAREQEQGGNQNPWASVMADVSQGVAKTIPKMAVLPLAGESAAAQAFAAGGLFGLDDQGHFSPKEAVIMGLLPGVGAVTRQATAASIAEAMARGVPLQNPLAQKVIEEIGHQAGLNAYMTATELPELAAMSQEERQKAMANIVGTNLAFGLLGVKNWRTELPSETQKWIQNYSEGFSQKILARLAAEQAGRAIGNEVANSGETSRSADSQARQATLAPQIAWEQHGLGVADVEQTRRPNMVFPRLPSELIGEEPGPTLQTGGGAPAEIRSNAVIPENRSTDFEESPTPLVRNPNAERIAELESDPEVIGYRVVGLDSKTGAPIKEPLIKNQRKVEELARLKAGSNLNPFDEAEAQQKAEQSGTTPRLVEQQLTDLKASLADLEATIKGNQLKPADQVSSESGSTAVASSAPEAGKMTEGDKLGLDSPKAASTLTTPAETPIPAAGEPVAGEPPVANIHAHENKLSPPVAGPVEIPVAKLPETPAATPIAPRRRSPFQVRPRPDGIPDILDAIQEHGGIAPLDAAVYGNWRDAFTGTARMLVRKGGTPADKLVDLLNGKHAKASDLTVAQTFRVESVDDLIEAVRNATAQREKLRTSGGGQAAQADRFWQAVSKTPQKTHGLVKIRAEELQPGDKFRLRGPGHSHEELEVRSVADGVVTLKDGAAFGWQEVPEGTEFWAIKKGLEVAAREEQGKAADEPAQASSQQLPGGKPRTGRVVPAVPSDPGILRARERMERSFRAQFGNPGAKITLTAGPERVFGGTTGGRSVAGGVESLADVFGKRVVWFQAEGLEPGRKLRGYADPDGKYLFVNSDLPATALGTTAHELLHSLETSNPELYADLRKSLLQLAKLPGSRYEDLKWDAGYKSHLGDELVSDFAAHSFNDPQFLKDLAKQNPGVFRSVVNRLVRLIDRVLAKLKRTTRVNEAAGEVFQDLTAARQVLAKALNDFAEHHANVREMERKGDGEAEGGASVDSEDLFGAPESVAEQKARLEREAQAKKEAEAKDKMRERAGKRLTGADIDTTAEMFGGPQGAATRQDKAGQGSLFSVDKAERNLAAVHNTSSDKLAHMLKMGGLPVPSIAIVRADKAVLEGFGDITLVGTPDLVTPSRETKVLNADAYSPRYPTVHYFPEQSGMAAAQKLVNKTLEKLPPKVGKEFSRFNLFNESPEKSVFEGLRHNSEMQLAYLDSLGRMPEFTTPQDERYAQSHYHYEVRNLVEHDDAEKPKFEAWLRDQIKALGLSETEKIYKGFTNAGNRSYTPHTLENVVKIMQKGFADAEGFNYGVGSIRAVTGKQFRTLEGIQKDRDKTIPKAQMDALKEEVDKEFGELHDYAMPYRQGGKNIGFGTLDAFSDDLKAMAQGGSDNFRHLREMYPGGEPFQKMREFLDKLRHLPTEYFEAKPRRAVQLQEFSGAVVPEGTSPDLIKQLERRGLDVRTYPKGNAEARRAAVENVASARNALFSTEADGRSIEDVKNDLTAAEDQMREAIRAAGDPARGMTKDEAEQAKALATARVRELQDELAQHPQRYAGLSVAELRAKQDEVTRRLAEIASTPIEPGNSLDSELRGERYRLLKDARALERELLNRPERVAEVLKQADQLTKDMRAAKEQDDATGARHAVDELMALQDSEFAKIDPAVLDRVRKELEARGEIEPVTAETKGRTLGDLTAWLAGQKLDSPKLTLRERLNLAKRLASEFTAGKDLATKAALRAGAMWRAFVAQWKAPKLDDAVRGIFKEWGFEKQFSGLETHQWRQAIRHSVPKKLRRQAISVWLDADGDQGLLRFQRDAVPERWQPVYEAALKLTPDEQALARKIKQDFQQKLLDGQLLGLIQQGRANYGVPQVWEVAPKHGENWDGGGDKGKKARNPLAKLDPRDPFFALQRTHDSYFDGIMAGGVPRSLDIADLVGVYNVDFHGALADRSLIRALKDAQMPDGTKAVQVSGAAKIEVLPSGARIQFVDSKWKPAEAVTEDGRPYRSVDHWALRGWKFAAKDAAGNNILVNGDFLVHPDLYRQMRTQLEGRSALRDPDGPLGDIAHLTNALLRSGAFLKASKFASATFHGATLAEHMMTHAFSGAPSKERLGLLNPWVGGVKVDPAHDAEVATLIRNGMDLGFGGHQGLFEEGLTSHGGIWSKVPGLGDGMAWLSESMFKEYLPRLKVKMGKVVLHANMARYAGKLNPQQIAELTANQVNAAFGGQNWALLGRSKTFLDVNRLFLTAPDFLLSRAKVVGQALKPYNREQLFFIGAQAAIVYALSRVLNWLLDDDPHWEPENALRVIHKGRAYSARFIVNDMLHAATDPAGFASGRLGPWPRTGFETITGRDMRTGARKDIPIDTENPIFRSAQIAVKDLAEWLIPVGAEGLMPGATGREQTSLGQFAVGLLGVGSQRYTPETEMYQLASKFNRDAPDPKAQLHQKARDDGAKTMSVYRKLDVLLEAEDWPAAWKEYQALIKDGHGADSIAQRYRATTAAGTMARPFTGSAEREKAFKASLTPEQRMEYNRAVTQRKDREKAFRRMLAGQGRK